MSRKERELDELLKMWLPDEYHEDMRKGLRKYLLKNGVVIINPEKKPEVLSDEYLQSCRSAVHAADPTHSDVVIKDLRSIVFKLTDHVTKLQKYLR